MRRRLFTPKVTLSLALLGTVLSGCSTTGNQPPSQATNEAQRRSIDTSVQGTLSRLYQGTPGARELVAKARGVLVFPSVVQAGFVVGGEHGDGALKVDGSTAGYYSITSASIGMQSKAIIYLFMPQDALDKFRNSNGWSAGGDASVALVKVGANGQIDTTTTTKPV